MAGDEVSFDAILRRVREEQRQTEPDAERILISERLQKLGQQFDCSLSSEWIGAVFAQAAVALGSG
jgi:hypothetical protein